jgi:hypothetical protein
VTSELRRAATFFVVLVVGIGAALLSMPGLLGAAAGPEAELVTILKRTESSGMTVLVSGSKAPLVSTRHRYDRITLDVRAPERKADAIVTLQLEGKLGSATVSSLGFERVRFGYTPEGWAPDEGMAPHLAGALSALVRRERALSSGDLAALRALLGEDATLNPDEGELQGLLALQDRRYEATAWYLRTEREGTVVTEHFRVTGNLPDRPVDRQGERRLRLVLHGTEFTFPDGVM